MDWAVVAWPISAYLALMSLGSVRRVFPETAAGAAAPDVARASPVRSFTMLVGLFAALAVAGGVLLWAHYGTTIFFETIRAGFSACFG